MWSSFIHSAHLITTLQSLIAYALTTVCLQLSVFPWFFHHDTRESGARLWALIRPSLLSQCWRGGRGGGLDPLFLLAENVGVSGRGPSPGQPSVVRSLPAGVSSALLCMDVVGDFWQRQRCWETNKDVPAWVLGAVFPSSLLSPSLTDRSSTQRALRRHGGSGSGCPLQGRRLLVGVSIREVLPSSAAADYVFIIIIYFFKFRP